MRVLLVLSSLLVAAKAGSHPSERGNRLTFNDGSWRSSGGMLAKSQLRRPIRYQAVRAAPDLAYVVIPRRSMYGKMSQPRRRMKQSYFIEPRLTWMRGQNSRSKRLPRNVDAIRMREIAKMTKDQQFYSTIEDTRQRTGLEGGRSGRRNSIRRKRNVQEPPYRDERMELEKITAQFKKMNEAQMDKFCQYLRADAMSNPLQMLDSLVGSVENYEMGDNNVHYDRNRGRILHEVRDRSDREKVILEWACKDRSFGQRFNEMLMGDALRSNGKPMHHSSSKNTDDPAKLKNSSENSSLEFPYDNAPDPRLIIKPVTSDPSIKDDASGRRSEINGRSSVRIDEVERKDQLGARRRSNVYYDPNEELV